MSKTSPVGDGGGAVGPYHRLRASHGMVTAEFALGLLAVVPVMVSVILLLAAASTQIKITEGARTAARMLARGDSEVAAREAVHAMVPQANLDVAQRGDDVVVDVRQTFRPASLLPAFTLHGTAVTPVEGADDGA